MDIYSKPLTERIDWLFNYARDHAACFCSADSWLARQRYLAEHPTAILVLKCMDGRINIPAATHTPLGVIHALRNIGGRFDLGWPYLGEILSQYVADIINAGRRILVLITYHYSKGSPQRGCAGFNFDTEAARDHCYAIKAQMEAVFGGNHQTVYPLVCGFETDEEALVLHGQAEDVLDVATLVDPEPDQIAERLQPLYPDMPAQMRCDLLPLVLDNAQHIAATRKLDRELDIEHREWMICVGRGFDWLHIPNQALIIGPYSPNIAEPIGVAASIIQANMDAGRIRDDGFLLLSSSVYAEPGTDRARAGLKSRFLCQFAAEVIASSNPALARLMVPRAAVLDERSQALMLIEHQ
jgi:hypothetical protein